MLPVSRTPSRLIADSIWTGQGRGGAVTLSVVLGVDMRWPQVSLPMPAAAFVPEDSSPLPMTATDQMARRTSVRMMAAMDRTHART